METKGLVALGISLASPETIRSWSHGEVLKPETINYRRLRPEKDGLFCEAIFGPTRDWQCYCGKYKNPRYKGIICDKCGVEVTRSAVRRERLGHIELATPIAHIWYTRRIPSYLGLLLDISRRNLDRVLYFAQYIVTYVDEDARQKALSRLEDEISGTEKEFAQEINQKILAVKAGRDKKIAQIQEQRNALMENAEEQITQKLDPVMKEGQRLEADLQEKIGQTLKADVYFNSANIKIAAAGESVGNQHISKIQKAVKEKLETIESDFKGQLQRDIERLDMDKQQVRAEAEEQMEALRNQLADQSTESQSQNSKLRDELQDLQPFTFLSESSYRELKSRWGQVFRADMGAEAFYDILKRLDLDQLSSDLWNEVKTTKSKQKRKKATSRLKVVESFRASKNHPEWMILTVLPVIPPDLRPMVQLDGGRFATSDLNDLYRRVINRNNRLKRLLELGAPDVIVRNEKRMLQEAVDSLIDNSQRGKALSRRGRRELKSLSDMLKGKKGRFRRNLLGKRVDYSGRSVIVVGAKLKLYQCGLPKTMALELFHPFLVSRLVEKGYATNVKGANRIIERNRPEVWEVLADVIGERPVLLNRAPTLHRLGIQAFEPVLIEGNAIQLHPLVCTAFNADFDGDQMAVHVPLSEKAVEEARTLMLASKNLLKPADGEPIISPSKDMVLGVFYLTMDMDGDHKGDGRAFYSIDEVQYSYDMGLVDLHAKIKFQVETYYDTDGKRLPQPEMRLVDTTVGRVIFNNILPPEMRFKNVILDKGAIKDLISEVYQVCDQEVTTEVADSIKDIGFEFSMRSGATIAVSDITIPETKNTMLADADNEVDQINRQWRRGLLTEQERNDRTIDVWQDTTAKIAKEVRNNMDPQGNMAVMANSGATKGGFGPIAQLAGMRGLMADPSGRIIRLPIKSNFREGLDALEYFISTHGARKGLADTALRTADAGYLTRRLVDVAQDLIINDEDCGTEDGIWIRRADDVAKQAYSERVFGRLTAERVVDPVTGEIIAEKGAIVDHALAKKINASNVQELKVRSPMTCELKHGICAKCYGLDLGRGKMVELGQAVGTVAAQSIGEPGTQLTLRTFHSGGVAQGGDITTGLPRVEELFEARRTPKGEAVITQLEGTAKIIQSDKYSDLRTIRVDHSELVSDVYEIPEGWTRKVTDEQSVNLGDVLAENGETTITAAHTGQIRIEENKIIVTYEKQESEEYDIPTTARLIIKDNQHVTVGQPLTEGSLNPHTVLKLNGRDACQMYILTEIQRVYRAQGQNINDKHFEVIIRKLLGKVQVTRSGDSPYLPMDIVDRLRFREMNQKLEAEGKTPAKAVEVLLGVTKASLSTDSWLSASSFQHTIKVLASAAIAGTKDPLFGLKENVIIGKLIPAGTGFIPGRFAFEDEIDQSTIISNLPSE
ncbi:DNA-directed RNA polymerase, beta' subunit, predominant form [Flexilinea flocculi]|uniref:DNA-directed RNA polymerase subunit beta' n=1 Tax=Flexilinea flocculi TaxID=1678840 RepID=A0A0S7BKF7_9CHLR|nr:DNA-directed RNA polymerase subunit beta' [Flexilinea flocculi]GAP40844.1 DNA-directed RNA polymerase, beta' subunit, predominant form [Flexilinea flocculi]